MSIRKALVLGGATGLLGKCLVCALDKCSEHEVFTLGREDGDIFDKPFLAEKLEEISPDIVFNTVAYTQVDKAEEEKDLAYKVNRDFPLMLGKLLVGSETSLVHYSTDFVFDGKKEAPYTEEDETNPLCVYGASKCAGELALRELALKNTLIIRTSWLFGPGRKNFISTILQKAKEGNELKIVQDQAGSPSYTLGIAANSLALVGAKAEGLYHLSNSGSATWFELGSEAVQIAGLNVPISPIQSSELSQAAQRPHYSVLSTEKFTKTTGITPRTWTHSLRDYIYHNFDFS